MEKVDLHVHSTCSDGTLTPTELVKLAKEQNLSAMALTDHDTIDGIPELIEAGNKYDLEVIPGVELSSFYDRKEIHIVGLYLDYTNEKLKSELEKLRIIRDERNLTMIEKFKEINIIIDPQEMDTLYRDSVITRAHFADYLCKKGYVKSRNEAFDRYLGDNGPCYVPRVKMTPEKTIDLIKNAGGVPILAHPILYHLGKEQMDKLVKYLCELGLVGIEAIYSTYTLSDEVAIRRIAQENHLIISGGSDYHGANKPTINLGTGRGRLFIPYDVLENIKNIVNKN